MIPNEDGKQTAAEWVTSRRLAERHQGNEPESYEKPASYNSHKQLANFIEDEGAQRRAEIADRYNRPNIETFTVRVFLDEAGDPGKLYKVQATSAMDARCIAYVLDGGCERGMDDWDAGHIELALTWTVIE